MNIGAVEIERRENEVIVACSGMDDDQESFAAVALTRKDALGIAWMLVKAALVWPPRMGDSNEA